GSDPFVSMHVPEQQLWPLVHAAAPPQRQEPLVQSSPMLHALPQAPQFCASFEVFLQPMPFGQHTWPAVQMPPLGQLPEPPMQAVPAPHTWPHAPQLALLCETSMHELLQHTAGAEQCAHAAPAMSTGS